MKKTELSNCIIFRISQFQIFKWNKKSERYFKAVLDHSIIRYWYIAREMTHAR